MDEDEYMGDLLSLVMGGRQAPVEAASTMVQATPPPSFQMPAQGGGGDEQDDTSALIGALGGATSGILGGLGASGQIGGTGAGNLLYQSAQGAQNAGGLNTVLKGSQGGGATGAAAGSSFPAAFSRSPQPATGAGGSVINDIYGQRGNAGPLSAPVGGGGSVLPFSTPTSPTGATAVRTPEIEAIANAAMGQHDPSWLGSPSASETGTRQVFGNRPEPRAFGMGNEDLAQLYGGVGKPSMPRIGLDTGMPTQPVPLGGVASFGPRGQMIPEQVLYGIPDTLYGYR